MKGVSLSGKTRLTYREAVALLEAANRGQAEIEADDTSDDQVTLGSLERALDKLKEALSIAGGYDAEGHLPDPFEKQRASFRRRREQEWERMRIQ